MISIWCGGSSLNPSRFTTDLTFLVKVASETGSLVTRFSIVAFVLPVDPMYHQSIEEAAHLRLREFVSPIDPWRRCFPV